MGSPCLIWDGNVSSVRSSVAPLPALSSGSVEGEPLTWEDMFGFVCVQATLCMAVDLLGVRDLSVSLLRACVCGHRGLAQALLSVCGGGLYLMPLFLWLEAMIRL